MPTTTKTIPRVPYLGARDQFRSEVAAGVRLEHTPTDALWHAARLEVASQIWALRGLLPGGLRAGEEHCAARCRRAAAKLLVAAAHERVP